MNIGLDLENPSTTAGSIKIACRLHKSYVPVVDEKYLKVVVFGDQNTVERLLVAKRARAHSGLVPHGRLLGIEPCPQDFHKRGIYNQVHF